MPRVCSVFCVYASMYYTYRHHHFANVRESLFIAQDVDGLVAVYRLVGPMEMK